MRVYLDNCCFNRPFDDQSSLIIRLETEAKLHVQELIRQGKLTLLWSFVLDYENGADSFLTTDKGILNKPIMQVNVMNPIDFIRRYFDA